MSSVSLLVLSPQLTMRHPPQYWAPASAHYAALLYVLRYLRSTVSRSLLYSSDSSLSLWAYFDIGWADDPKTHRFTTGFYVFPSSSLISWRSKCQDVVYRSSTEFEYHTMADTVLELR